MEAILQTKLYVPRQTSKPSQRPTIPRLHLWKKLDAARTGKLTLVSAPTGFGKTTLVAGWLAQLTAPQGVWLSLDDRDNDSARFLTYFIAALRGVVPSLGEAVLLRLQAAQTPAWEALLTDLLNEIGQLEEPVLLVLDDFHLIDAPQVQRLVQFVLQNQPPTLHLVLISRADPPWPLARWRAQGNMVELRGDDLRFSLAETADFLNGIMELGLSAAQLTMLDARLEGWAAGLQMAALSWRGRQVKRRGHSDWEHFLASFAGSHRFVQDYLVEEVLQQQSDDVQSFLLRSAVLERLCGSLCDAVLERTDSQPFLRQLEQANLFLVPQDEARRWYRYHPLFRELLNGRLQQIEPEVVRPLQLRASAWYEAQDLLDEAVGYGLAAGDFERVAQLIAVNGLAVAYHGELKQLLGWLEALPLAIVEKRPFLQVAYAWALGFAGQLAAAESRLQKAERLMATVDATDASLLRGHIALVQAYCAGINVAPARTTELATVALQHLDLANLAQVALGHDNWFARGMATLLLAIGLRTMGDLAGATAVFTEAMALSRAADDQHLMIDVLWERTVLEFRQGRLGQVLESCQTALRWARSHEAQSGRRLPVKGYILERMSAVLTERNELTAALDYAQEGFELSQHWGQADAIVTCQLRLAAVRLAIGELEPAMALVEAAESLAAGLGEWYGLTVAALKVRLWLAMGTAETAVNWLEARNWRGEEPLDLLYSHIYLAIARIMLAQGRLSAAAQLLSRLVTLADAAGAVDTLIRALVLQAVVLHAKDELEGAKTALARSLVLAEPEGYRRVFVDAGAVMEQLLPETAVSGHSAAYVNQLLAVLAQDRARQDALSSSAASQFSARELQVLRLLASGKTAVAIAKELVIAPSTVRSHIKNIYRKLDVHKRITAVERAQALGLL